MVCVKWLYTKIRKKVSGSAFSEMTLKVNSKVGNAAIQVNGKSVKTVRVVRYSGDHFNFKGNKKDLCKERLKRAKVTIIELMALCRDTCFGIKQI